MSSPVTGRHLALLELSLSQIHHGPCAVIVTEMSCGLYGSAVPDIRCQAHDQSMHAIDACRSC